MKKANISLITGQSKLTKKKLSLLPPLLIPGKGENATLLNKKAGPETGFLSNHKDAGINLHFYEKNLIKVKPETS